MKLAWLRRRNAEAGGRCCAMFTGTPVANTLAEVYTWMRYLMPDYAERLHLGSFDGFAGMFIAWESKIETAPDGSGFRQHRRPARFVNVPELRLILSQVADIRVREGLIAGGPRVVFEVVSSDPQPEMGQVVDELVQLAEQARRSGGRKGEPCMLDVTNRGRRAAVDLRLAGVATPTGPGKI